MQATVTAAGARSASWARLLSARKIRLVCGAVGVLALLGPRLTALQRERHPTQIRSRSKKGARHVAQRRFESSACACHAESTGDKGADNLSGCEPAALLRCTSSEVPVCRRCVKALTRTPCVARLLALPCERGREEHVLAAPHILSRV